MAIPSFTAEAVRKRLTRLPDPSLDALLFCNREGTPLTTNSVRRQLRHVIDIAGITGVTPHIFRRTVATVINEQAGVDLAIGSLKRWLRGRGNSPGELLALAQDFPTARPAMQNALEVLL